MSHRTYGETRDCKGCRFWSEMIAGCNGGGPVQALCLAPKPAPQHGKYMPGYGKCEAWKSGHLGAVDEPGEPPDYTEDDEAAVAFDNDGVREAVNAQGDPSPHGKGD